MKPTNRKTDQLIGAEDVRLIMMRLGQNGWRRVLRDMEWDEPSLASFLSTASKTMLLTLFPKLAIRMTSFEMFMGISCSR